MTERLERWKKKLTKENMAVLALLGLLLMVIAIPTGGGRENKTEAVQEADQASEQEVQNAPESETERYAAELEKRLEELLSSMDGVGEAKVMITLSASGENVVEKDIPSESDRTRETDSEGGTREIENIRQEESTVYVTDSDGSRTPYVSRTTQPEIEGVTVVAQGGADVLIQKNITEVIQALFDIEAHKIKVVKMK